MQATTLARCLLCGKKALNSQHNNLTYLPKLESVALPQYGVWREAKQRLLDLQK
jgi:hypothetical protein